MPLKKFRRAGRVGAALGCTMVAGALPASAHAAECLEQPSVQAFAWAGDANWYFLAPEGDFEGSSSWAKNAKATITRRTQYTGYIGANQLELAPGGSATSPSFCVDVKRTHLRSGVRALGGTGTLKVEAVVGGTPRTLGTLAGTSYANYGITGDVPLASLLGVLSGKVKQVQLRVTSLGGTWQIDGVAIDPRRS